MHVSLSNLFFQMKTKLFMLTKKLMKPFIKVSDYIINIFPKLGTVRL